MHLVSVRLSRIKVAAAASSIFVAGACSLIVDADREQCVSAADCAGHGLTNPVCDNGICKATSLQPNLDAGEDAGPVDPVWGCIAKPVPVPAEERSTPVNFPLRFLDSANGGLANVSVLACEETDPDCATPTFTGTTPEDGSIDIALFNGYKGFVKLDPDAGGTALYPTYIPVLPIPDKADAHPYTGVWPIFTAEYFPNVALFSGGEALKPGYAHVLFIALTCDRRRAPGMRVTPEPKATDTYAFFTDDNNLPSRSLEETQKDGVGGFINLPTGNITFTVRNKLGQLVSTHSLFVRPDTLTIVSLDPTGPNP